MMFFNRFLIWICVAQIRRFDGSTTGLEMLFFLCYVFWRPGLLEYMSVFWDIVLADLSGLGRR